MDCANKDCFWCEDGKCVDTDPIAINKRGMCTNQYYPLEIHPNPERETEE